MASKCAQGRLQQLEKQGVSVVLGDTQRGAATPTIAGRTVHAGARRTDLRRAAFSNAASPPTIRVPGERRR